MELIVVGLSHHTAPLAVRERLAFAEAELAGALAEIVALPDVGEALLVSTCNRVEVVAAVRATESALGEVRNFLGKARGIDGEVLARHLYEHAGEAALRHTFRVASALDSMV